jgi:hypothetical protein
MLVFLKQRAMCALCLFSRNFLCLFLLLLSSCSTSACRQWEIQEIGSKIPCFNGGRLILEPDSDYSHLELEIIRNSSGIRFYINLLFLQASPWPKDPSRTCLTIQFSDQEPWMVYPYLLEGGQRLLLPRDVADILVQSILDENAFTLQLGRSQISVVSTNFMKSYQRLLVLPIEENRADEQKD